MTTRDFKKLMVWEKAHAFALAVYQTTKGFPKDELYGLTSQLRRAAVSIPSNLAEGCGRGGNAELARFCDISMGSACESEYQLLLAKDLNYVCPESHSALTEQVNEVQRMLTGLAKSLRKP